MNNFIPSLTRERAAQIAQRLRLWLVLWLARLADILGDDAPLSRALRGLVRNKLVELERSMKATLVLMAYADSPWTLRRPRHRPPFKAPRGFRRHTRHGSALRHVTRGLLGRCDLATRIARLRLLLHVSARSLDYIRKRILRGLTNGRLVICAVARCVVCGVAAPEAPCADTS